MVKSGFANSGKQMFLCKECEKRFVVDRGLITSDFFKSI
ncbi:IS1/IS1595 family N-terminal zinc-binding domain-containing protein [Holdemanella biformis]